METPAGWTTWPCSWKFDSSDFLNFWNELSENWQTHNCHNIIAINYGPIPHPWEVQSTTDFPPDSSEVLFIHLHLANLQFETIFGAYVSIYVYIYIGTCTGSVFSPSHGRNPIFCPCWSLEPPCASHVRWLIPIFYSVVPIFHPFSVVASPCFTNFCQIKFPYFEWNFENAQGAPTKSFRLVVLTPPDRSGLAHKARRRSLLDCWPKESGVWIHKNMYVCLYVSMFVCVYVSMPVRAYVCLFFCL